MLETGFATSLGSLAEVLRIGMRQVMNGTTPVGYALVLEFPGAGAILDQPGFLDSMAASMGGSDGTVTKATILAEPVRLVSTSGQYFAIYKRGEGVVAVFGTTAKDAKAMVTALIRANQ